MARPTAGRARDPIGGQGAPWAMVRLAPPADDALGRALAARDPGYQALHISAHGTPAGLLLEDEQGREALLPTARLVALLRDSGVRLVVLNACDSAAIGQALVEQAGVACAIATRSQIYEPEAALLSDRLYGYLAAGRSVGAAQASYGAALALYRAIDAKLGEVNVLAAQSRLLIDAEAAQSQRLLEQAVQQHQSIGSIYGAAADLYRYGQQLLDRERRDEALSYLLRARELFTAGGLTMYVENTGDLIARARAGLDNAASDADA